MTSPAGRAAPTVRCRCGDIDVKGTYAVDGRFLVLTTPFGITRTLLGLQDPRKLARRLFKRVCEPSCAKTCALNVPTTVDALDPAVIDTICRTAGRRRRCAKTAPTAAA